MESIPLARNGSSVKDELNTIRLEMQLRNVSFSTIPSYPFSNLKDTNVLKYCNKLKIKWLVGLLVLVLHMPLDAQTSEKH